MPDFYTVVTDTGLQALGLASTQGQRFSLTHAVVGDGNGLAVLPEKGMTTLVNEVWRGDVTGLTVDSDDPNTFIFEFAIPADIGGFTIREVGLLDESGKLFCIGNFPDTEKPVAVNGSVRDLVVRLPLHFENAEEVNLVIDTTVAIATKQDVLDHNADPEAHEIMKSDSVELDSSEKVATSKAVKTVNDKIVEHEMNEDIHVPDGGSVGECLTKIADGLAWGSVGVQPSDFPAQVQDSGWQKLPSGLILQWGLTVIKGGVGYWYYPIAFPNRCFLTVCSQDAPNNTISVGSIQDKTNAETLKIRAKVTSSYTAGADGIFVFAIGY